MAEASPAQTIGRGIVPKSISLAAELFIELCQVTVRLEKIRRMLERLLIGRDGRALLLSILEHDAEVEMRERQLRVKFQGAPVTSFRIGQVAEIVMQEPEIDVRIERSRLGGNGALKAAISLP